MNAEIIDDELEDINLAKKTNGSQNISIISENPKIIIEKIGQCENEDNKDNITQEPINIESDNDSLGDIKDTNTGDEITIKNDNRDNITNGESINIESENESHNDTINSKIVQESPKELINNLESIITPIIKFIDDDQEEVENSKVENDVAINTEKIEQPIVRPKRAIPKKILANQQKYLELLEKQNNMKLKKNKKADKNKKTEIKEQLSVRRINVAGKIKYIPISNNDTKKISTPIENTDISVTETQNIPKLNSIEKSPDLYINHKIPIKYAKIIEKQVKKATEKNVKNFKDLRRIKALNDINLDNKLDVTKASILELRKLRSEQRKKEQLELKNSKVTKKESKIQEILSNDKLSKFSKVVAINNLSINSRHNRLKIEA